MFDDIRFELNNIINSEVEKIYVNYLIVFGFGVDNVRYDGKELVSEFCIVIYCLDKFLLLYGEKMLLISFGGYLCDIWEGVFMFGNCVDCWYKDLDFGCFICRLDGIDIGSVGFFVRFIVLKKDIGFLIVVYVVIEDIVDLYDERVCLLRCRYDLKVKWYDVIYLLKLCGLSCVGKVKYLFIGNDLEN